MGWKLLLITKTLHRNSRNDKADWKVVIKINYLRGQLRKKTSDYNSGIFFKILLTLKLNSPHLIKDSEGLRYGIDYVIPNAINENFLSR